MKSPLWFQMDPATIKSGGFRGSLNVDGRMQSIVGVMASERGIAFLSQTTVNKSEIDVRFTIREREVPARVKIVSQDETRRATKARGRFVTSASSSASKPTIGISSCGT